MLNTQPPASGTQAAAPTTQEIAQAIASLETRKAAQGGNTVEMDTVTEIIDNLGLDMTAAEVLAEVQVQRARTKPMASLPSAVRKRIALMVGAAALIFLGIVFEAADTSPPDTPPAAVSTPTAYMPPPQHLAITPDTLVKDASSHAPTLKTLAEIPDNHPVLCGLTSGGQTSTSPMNWTLIKHDGQVYLRCFTLPMSVRALAQASTNDELILYPGRAEGMIKDAHATARLTVPVSSLTLQPDGAADGSLHPLSLRLDSHAYEPWKP